MTCLASFVDGVLIPQRKPSFGRNTIAPATKPVDNAVLADIASALAFVDPNPYSSWSTTIMRAKTAGEGAREIVRVWSARSSKHSDAEFNTKWDGVQPDRTGFAAIFADAQRNGWSNPGRVYGVSISTIPVGSPFAAPSRYKLLSGSDLTALAAMEWRIKGLLPAQGVAVVFGPSGAGKSFLAFDMLCTIAEGRDFFGLRTKPTACVYFGLEGRSGVRGRSIAWETINGRELPVRVILDTHDLKNPNDVTELAKVCPQGCVIVIDTLARAGDDDENDGKQRALVINGAMELQRLVAGLVMLVAHTGKDEDKGLRGHKKLFDALDASISVTRHNERRIWQATKVKDGEDGISRRFKLATIPIGTDEDGDEITSCVIAPEHGTFTGTTTKPLTAGQVHGLTSYRVAAGVSGKLDDAGNFVGLHIDDWRNEFYRSSTLDKTDAKRKAFSRARAELVEVGELAVDNDFYVVAGPTGIVTNAAIAAQIRGGTA